MATEFQPKAVFTFFSLSGCGYCNIFKGENKDSKGRITIDPKNGWDTLRNDPDLYNAGVQFVLYQVGDVKDPATGKVKRYELEPEFKGKVRGFPHLRLTRPDDRFNGAPFDGKISGWQADQSFKGIKSWILQKLKESPFAEYQVSSAAQSTNTRIPTASSRAPSQIKTPGPAPSAVYRAEQGARSVAVPQAALKEAVPLPPPQSRGGQNVRVQDIPKPGEFQTQEVAARPTATVFGLGTRKVSVVPDRREQPVQDSRTVVKKAPKFLPSNYDD